WFGTDTEQFAIRVIPDDAGYLLASLNNLATLPRVRAAGDSTIARVRSRSNTLQVGVATDQAPFSFTGESGQVVGFDIDLVNALAAEWDVAIELTPVTAADRIQKLRSGEIDLLAIGLERTKNQADEIDFSQTYFVGGAGLLTNRDSGITEINDLNNRSVAVLATSSLDDQLLALTEANETVVNLLEYANIEAAVEALRQGTVAGVLADRIVLAQLTNSGEIDAATWTVIGNVLEETPYSFGLPADDSYFQNLVNTTLQTLKTTGVYDNIYRRWFGSETAPYALEVLPGDWPYTFAESPTALDVPIRSRVEEIQQRGQIVAGVPFALPPFGSSSDATDPRGFDVDLVREFAKRWLGDGSAINFVPVTPTDAAQVLAEGTVDLVAAALPHLADAEERIDFSQTYYQGQQAILVRIEDQFASLTALNNRTLAAVQGSPSIAQLQTVANRDGLVINLQPFPTFDAAFAALRTGQVNGVIGLQPVLEQFTLREAGFVVIAGLLPRAAYGIGIPNYDGRFQDLVNFTLQEMKLDGTYDRLYRQWLGESEPTAIEIWPGRSYLALDMIPMVRIPAGEFVQGNLYGFPDERAEQPVFLDEFYIDQYEVTNRQYADCVGAGRCALPQLPRSVNFANYYAASEFGNHPVIWVTWNDAVNYCTFRGKRLPTEAEWEKAARGPENTLYPWGKEEPTTQTNFNYLAGDATAVGSFSADVSGYGANDMGGNVREWVADWYQWDYYLDAPQKNPLGPAEGVTKVLRGGSWNDVAIYVRATSRKNFLPNSFDSNLGFRCATSTFPPSRD
ncbi:MAG: transporter substrate-binding domain-containing protein, partial [Caldilineaceae bacterium]|nr:transporter substrate-binding domain-containing protein [Caldilineaceae bacterium]